jgi:hypothetical protein
MRQRARESTLLCLALFLRFSQLEVSAHQPRNINSTSFPNKLSFSLCQAPLYHRMAPSPLSKARTVRDKDRQRLTKTDTTTGSKTDSENQVLAMHYHPRQLPMHCQDLYVRTREDARTSHQVEVSPQGCDGSLGSSSPQAALLQGMGGCGRRIPGEYGKMDSWGLAPQCGLRGSSATPRIMQGARTTVRRNHAL